MSETVIRSKPFLARFAYYYRSYRMLGMTVFQSIRYAYWISLV